LEFAFAFTQSIYPSGIIFSFLPIYWLILLISTYFW
jgi:hypothetical protein